MDKFRVILKVTEKLNECREILDDAMYRSGTIPEEDFKFLRKIYDSICSTIDLT